jgi:hypothetical protein
MSPYTSLAAGLSLGAGLVVCWEHR